LFPVLFGAALAAADTPAAAPAAALKLHLIGDSTMADKPTDPPNPEHGWGQMLPAFFRDPATVVNHAANGRSTKSFIDEGRWQQVLDALHPGDYVLIQFGHNDESKEKVDRYTPPDDFRRNLARFVDDARARKAIPVLLTPVRRRKFDDAGRLVDTHGEYPDLVRAVAAEKQVPLLDMHQRSAAVLERFGPEGSRTLFLQLQPGEHPNYPAGIEDNTHFTPLGAELMAREAAEGLKELGIGLSAMVRLPAVAPPAAAGARP
jgi:lysophospholipase L1-like esterase